MGQGGIPRRQLMQVLATLTAGAALTSCSSGSIAPTGSSSEGASRVFRFAQAAPALAMDPARTQRVESARITAQVLDSLVGADTNTGEPVKNLVEEWEISDDSLTYVFTLHEGLVFSDGTALTAQTVIANFERWKTLSKQPRSRLLQPYQQLFTGSNVALDFSDPLVKSWEAQGSHRFTVTLSRPSAAFLKALTQPVFGIVLPDHIGQDGYLNTPNPVGTGAYVFESWNSSLVKLTANPRYRGQLPGIDVLEFVTLPDAEKRYYSLSQGSIDAYDQVALKDYVPLALAGYAVQSRDPYAIAYVNINLAHPAFADSLTRRALAQSIDRGKISTDYYPQGTSTASDFLPALFQMKNSELGSTYRYSPSQAKKLLEQSTYSGQVIDFFYPVQVSLAALPSPESIYSVIAANLTEVGFNIKPRPYRWGETGSEDIPSSHPGYGLELTGFMGAFRDPTAFLGRVLSPATNAPKALTGTPAASADSDPSASASAEEKKPTPVPVSFDTLVESIRAADTLDSIEKRREAYRAINEDIAQLMPAVPLVYPVSGVTQGERVTSYTVNATGIDGFHEVTVRN